MVIVWIITVTFAPDDVAGRSITEIFGRRALAPDAALRRSNAAFW